MSGRPCIIIITGNRSQAYARSIAANMVNASVIESANYAEGVALSLCQLGTYSYDGAEVMTDEQQQEAIDLMTAFNDAIAPYATSTQHKDVDAIMAAFAKFNGAGDTLLASVVVAP